MQKKSVVLFGLLLVISIAGQVLLRPCLGESTVTDTASSPQQQKQTVQWWQEQGDKSTSNLDKNLTGRLFLMLGFIAVAGAGVWYFLKKMNTPWAGTKNGHLKLLETMHLGPRKAIHIIRAGQKRLLISNSNDGIRLLSDLTETDDFEPGDEEIQ